MKVRQKKYISKVEKEEFAEKETSIIIMKVMLKSSRVYCML